MNIPKIHAVVLRKARERNVSLLPDVVEPNRQVSGNGTDSHPSETSPANGTSQFARNGKRLNGAAGDLTDGAVSRTSPDHGRAVLIIGEAGEILFARDKCDDIFGWEPPALVGQNVRVLLKRGLDNPLGEFLHGLRTGKGPDEKMELRVTVVRKNGSELPAVVSTLSFQAKSEAGPMNWTAAFRDGTLPTSEAPTVVVTPVTSLPDEVVTVVSSEPDGDSGSEKTVGPPPPSEKPTSGGDVPVHRWPEQLLEAAKRAAGAKEAALRQERDEFKRKLASEQSASAELKRSLEDIEARSRKMTAELESLRAEVEKRKRAEIDVRVQLDGAKEQSGYANAALKDEVNKRKEIETQLKNLRQTLGAEHTARCQQLSDEIANLRRKCEEHDTTLSLEKQKAAQAAQRTEELQKELERKQAEFDRTRLDLEKLNVDRRREESVLREQLDTAWFSKKEVEGEWSERHRRLEDELIQLRGDHEELTRKFAGQLRATAESKAEVERQKAERVRLEEEWTEQVNSAKALHAQVEASLAESLAHNMRSEQELASLRQERDDLCGRLSAQEEAMAESSRQIAELHKHLDQNSAEAQRLKAELEKELAGREALERTYTEQLESANSLGKKLESDWSAAVQRNVQFEEELAAIRLESDELNAKLQAAQQTAAEATWRADDLERRVGRNAVELENAKAEIAKRDEELERLDAETREELSTAKALARKLDAAWTTAVERNRCYEAEVAGLRLQCEELQAKLTRAEGASGSGGNSAVAPSGPALGTEARKPASKRAAAESRGRKQAARPRRNEEPAEAEEQSIEIAGTGTGVANEAADPGKEIKDPAVPQYDFAHSNGESTRPKRLPPSRRGKS